MNDATKCRIKMIKAHEGDCFFLRFTFERQVFNLLIDCGPASCWDSDLRPALDDLISLGERVNLMIVTHIDSDHIGGALKLFSVPKYSQLVDEIWFNGFKQVIQDNSIMQGETADKAYARVISQHGRSFGALEGPISAEEAASLAEKLKMNEIYPNIRFSGKAISASCGRVDICQDFSIDILLPTQKCLDKLKLQFQIAVERAKPGSLLYLSDIGERAFESLFLDGGREEDKIELISETLPTYLQIERWKDVEVGRDMSVTNGSSIAVCINFYGKTLLFAGDASAEDLIAALKERCEIYGEHPFFNVIKLPHHGAAKNCVKVLELIDGQNFLISTDGKKFHHPSKATLAKIVSAPARGTRELFFNYDNQMYQLFKNEKAEEKYHYNVYLAKQPLYLEGEYNE